MTRFFTLSLFFILQLSSFSQDTQEIKEQIDTVEAWKEDSISKYSGFYVFGNGETESDLKIIVTEDLIVAQIMNGYWESGTDEWKWNYRNLSNVKIDSQGNFSSNKYSGKFITYKDDKFIVKGLKINKHWSPSTEIESEIGSRIETPFEMHQGKYTFTSLRILEKKELKKFDLKELIIIKNEIYARYGYNFKKNSELEKYFQNQNWYNPQYDNVDDFLTEIEKINIKEILIQENKKK
tara:strand:+ start:84410 stop:85120 length:711 start_codon:yes stop_codon:yes gene_type:complete